MQTNKPISSALPLQESQVFCTCSCIP